MTQMSPGLEIQIYVHTHVLQRRLIFGSVSVGQSQFVGRFCFTVALGFRISMVFWGRMLSNQFSLLIKAIDENLNFC